MEEKKWNAGSIGLTFAGSFLGAGYVSGQELWQFFGSFGGGGLLGVLAALALLAVFGLALMYIISRTGIAEMDAVLVPWKRLAWLRKLSSALQLILLFGVIAIMYAGGGALLSGLDKLLTEETGLPVFVSEEPLNAVAKGTGVMLQEDSIWSA